MLSQALLNELGIIIEQDYGIRLKPEAVSEIGNSLVGFFDSLASHHYQNSVPTTKEVMPGGNTD